MSIGPLGTNFSEILIAKQNFSITKMHLKIPSAKWGPFCPGGDELTARDIILQHIMFELEYFTFICNNIQKNKAQRDKLLNHGWISYFGTQHIYMVHNCGRNLRFLLLIMLYGQDMWIQIHWKICSSHSQEGAWSPLTHCGQVMPYGNIHESTLAQVMVCCLRATDQYRANIDHWIWWYLVMSHDISYTSNCPRPTHFIINKANLRDLIAVTGLVIFLNLNSNRPFFIRCDLQIWWMT